MLKGLSKLSLEQIHNRSKSNIFDPRIAFNEDSLNTAPLTQHAIEFLKKWNLPENSNAMRLGGFPIYTKTNPNYGKIQWFPKLGEWHWAFEFTHTFPEAITNEIVLGSASGVNIGLDGAITGYSDQNGGPICIKSDGSIVYYPEEDFFKEYTVNSDIEKLLYCLVFFQTMAALGRLKTKKDPQFHHILRPDYCDTIYEEMRAIDPKAIESPLSFWPLMLDLACFKHPLANGRRRYNIGG